MTTTGKVSSLSIGLLVDGNDDTFPVYTLAKDLNYVFDFGPKFKFSAPAFALEGRLNFEDRVTNTKFFGSNDGKSWTELTPKAIGHATELMRVEVAPDLTHSMFRFLRIQKQGGTLFEPSELRIYGERHETERRAF
jgi:large repetitive protein